MKKHKRGVILIGGLAVLVLGVALGVARMGTRPPPGAPPPTEDAPPLADTSQRPGERPGRPSPADPGQGPAKSSKPREVFAELGWGSGPSQLGRERPQEGNPEAPMSLATTPQGEAVVLDQINGRLVRLGPDGLVRGTTPLTQQTPQDVTVAKDGTLLVLDRLKDQSVALIDPITGELKGDLPVTGPGIPNPGGITGTFVDGDSVYVEREHGALVRIGDLSGKADPSHPEIPGRPTRDGRTYILARLIDAPAGRLFVNAIDRASGQRRYTREYRLQFPLMAITLLDSDRAGIIYLGVAGQLPTGKASPATEPGVRLFCLDPLDGKVLGQADLPLNTLPEETFRDFTVLDEGGVLFQLRTESGVTLRRADCR
ncbi:hypothetical protein [Stigmatella aurantiaca]|uniref:Conserved uncharacterized protein n=2 Tax=Stigmatella aurantiaca (strain DW4/3-1) TaxID=378806 RepID=E3FN16_STIAD|nr:hypothetical protein [Stigmatella aurantiaca]ADO73131.1 conserved uncharacterized protein [Stigmatella aurantiaca DW4/3-1]